MGAGVSAGIEIEIEIERKIVISSKVIFFLFGRYNISVGIIGDSVIVISSALEILVLEADLTRY